MCGTIESYVDRAILFYANHKPPTWPVVVDTRILTQATESNLDNSLKYNAVLHHYNGNRNHSLCPFHFHQKATAIYP